MATYVPTNKKLVHACEFGNAGIYTNNTTAATGVAGDKFNVVEIPAGLSVSRVVIKTADLDSGATPALAAKIGFAPSDGSAAVSGADTAVSAAAAFGQAAGTTTFEIFPSYRVEVDSYLVIEVTTGAATSASGVIHGKCEGTLTGVK